jgi:hypothetical protein
MNPRMMPSFPIVHNNDKSNEILEVTDPACSFEVGKMFFFQTVERIQSKIVRQKLLMK